MSNDIIGSTEQLSRRFRLRRTNIGNNSVASRDDIDRFRVLLDRGFEVMHHDRSGVVQKAILSFHGPSNSFVLKPVKSSFLKFFKVEPLVSIHSYNLSLFYFIPLSFY